MMLGTTLFLKFSPILTTQLQYCDVSLSSSALFAIAALENDMLTLNSCRSPAKAAIRINQTVVQFLYSYYHVAACTASHGRVSCGQVPLIKSRARSNSSVMARCGQTTEGCDTTDFLRRDSESLWNLRLIPRFLTRFQHRYMIPVILFTKFGNMCHLTLD